MNDTSLQTVLKDIQKLKNDFSKDVFFALLFYYFKKGKIFFLSLGFFVVFIIFIFLVFLFLGARYPSFGSFKMGHDSAGYFYNFGKNRVFHFSSFSKTKSEFLVLKNVSFDLNGQTFKADDARFMKESSYGAYDVSLSNLSFAGYKAASGLAQISSKGLVSELSLDNVSYSLPSVSSIVSKNLSIAFDIDAQKNDGFEASSILGVKMKDSKAYFSYLPAPVFIDYGHVDLSWNKGVLSSYKGSLVGLHVNSSDFPSLSLILHSLSSRDNHILFDYDSQKSLEHFQVVFQGMGYGDLFLHAFNDEDSLKLFDPRVSLDALTSVWHDQGLIPFVLNSYNVKDVAKDIKDSSLLSSQILSDDDLVHALEGQKKIVLQWKFNDSVSLLDLIANFWKKTDLIDGHFYSL